MDLFPSNSGAACLRPRRNSAIIVVISEEERDYLLSAVSEYLRVSVNRDQIVWSFSGVRPLFDDGAAKAQESSRDYVLRMELPESGGAPLLSCLRGKITTYRVLAEDALRQIEAAIGELVTSGKHGREGWTGRQPLPGGDFEADAIGELCRQIAELAPGLAEPVVHRLAQSYGTDALRMLSACPLGEDFGHGLFEAEVTWLINREWARTVRDILWRRTKLGLKFSPTDTARLSSYLEGCRESVECSL